jgi:hypothetical protein
MKSPPSGLPVLSSHTTTAITAAVNPIRRTSIFPSLRPADLDVHDDRDRAVVHKLDLHPRAEDARLDVNAEVA